MDSVLVNPSAPASPIERNYKILGEDESPQPGSLVALDAEFVALQLEETEVRADGTKETIRPSRNGLGRVSVLRGEGMMEGVPFIDDYIITRETVADHLTEYSGIHPGDLEPGRSKKPLVPLKVAYKKLWLLLNSGCIFVGHGLVKDFRTISKALHSIDKSRLLTQFRHPCSQRTSPGYSRPI